VSTEIKKLLKKRDDLRAAGEYEKADKVRDQIIKMGFTVKDTHV